MVGTALYARCAFAQRSRGVVLEYVRCRNVCNESAEQEKPIPHVSACAALELPFKNALGTHRYDVSCHLEEPRGGGEGTLENIFLKTIFGNGMKEMRLHPFA